MKQLLQNMRTGETQVVDVPVPSPSPRTALVRTAASLVSAGTERMLVDFAEKSLLGKARSRPDLVRQVLDKARREGLLSTIDAAFNRLDQPMPLGYSSAGVIEALGEGLHGFAVGQRVACAGGGFAVHAEFNIVPQNLMAALPENVGFESAAFTTLGAIALHGFRLAEAQIGERVMVIGLGLLGLLAAVIARAAGCVVLGVDLDQQRVELAGEMGVSATFRENAEEAARTFTRSHGVDVILICADTPSADPVELAGTIARDRARVVAIGAVGQSLPRKMYYEKELSFINSRSYGPGRYDPTYEQAGQDYPIGYVRWTEGRNLEAFVELLASGSIDVRPLITHRFPIDHAPAAYELITGKKKEPFLGVVLTYPSNESKAATPDTPPVHLQKDGRQASPVLPVEIQQVKAETIEKPSTIPQTTCKLGVLGAGNYASAILLPAIKSLAGVELVGVASAGGVSAAHAQRRYGFRYACTDEAELINDPSVTTVAILTRHGMHARQVMHALAAGKHIFCEKPLALSMDQLSEISDQLAQLPPLSQMLTVGYNRRFAPLSLKLSAFLASRQEPLAAHYRVNAGYLPPGHWVHDPEQGGGRILGEACHFIDYLAFLVGAPPISVQAIGLPDGGRYREDNVVMNFTFSDGSVGTVTYVANGDKSFSKERVEVFFGGRAAVLDDFRMLEMVRDGRRQSARSRLRQDKGHASEWRAFVDAIASGGPPPIPYEHLFGVTAATITALQALRTGDRLSIPEIW